MQWARIVLVVERGVPPAERLKKLMDYSQPMADGRRALVLRLNQSVYLLYWNIFDLSKTKSLHLRRRTRKR
jgi:hypothetical protein